LTPSQYLRCVVIALALVSCSRQQFDPTGEGEKLLRRDAEWSDLATAGKDVEKVVSYWSDDAVLIFPGQPLLEGKAAIRDYVAASFNSPGFKIHWVSQKPVFSPDGKFAYMRGKAELTLPGPNGSPMTGEKSALTKTLWATKPRKAFHGHFLRPEDFWLQKCASLYKRAANLIR
jgi:ketosteroid isomerase-like protein